MYDVIVIGAGLGSLTAAAKLSKEGKKVLVLEQHSVPGGYATTYKRRGFLFEVGLQELDGLDEKDIKTAVFNDLNLKSSVRFVSLPKKSLFCIEGEHFEVPDNKKEAEESLCRLFPGERRGIKKYFRLMTGIRDELVRLPLTRSRLLLCLPLFPLFYPHITCNLFQTIGRFLKRSVKNTDLQLILLGNLFYYHNNPLELSLLYYAAGQGGFCRGSHFIRGGSQTLSDALARIVTEKGGAIEYRADVRSIETEGGRVTGVTYRKGGRVFHCGAPCIIAGNSPLTIASRMLPDSRGKRSLWRKAAGQSLSMSFTQISMAFKVSLCDIGVSHYKTVLHDTRPSSQADFMNYVTGAYEHRPVIFTDYGQIDSGLSESGLSYGVVLIPDLYRNWIFSDKGEYNSRKEAVAEIILKRLEGVYPGIQEALDFYEVATPVTMEHYTRNPEGVIYGFAQKPLQAGLFRIPVKSPVRGLYFASAWTWPGGGFTGALWSGWSCAREII